ncbi:MAG: hypothetical protein Q9160_008174 [Pyrenula sp. 1 TL-2023]
MAEKLGYGGLNIKIGEARRRVEETPTGPMKLPIAKQEFLVNENVITGTKGPEIESDKQPFTPIDQVVSLGETGRNMCEGEFESLKAISTVSPGFVPQPLAWGKYKQENPETYFLLAEFRDVGAQVRSLRIILAGKPFESRKNLRKQLETNSDSEQPADRNKLAPRLADMHFRSKSPTGNVFDDMTDLCKMFFPQRLQSELHNLILSSERAKHGRVSLTTARGEATSLDDEGEDKEEEEEEEEEEEQEQEEEEEEQEEEKN